MGSRTEAVTVIRGIADCKKRKAGLYGLVGLAVCPVRREFEMEFPVSEDASYCRSKISRAPYKP